MAAIPSVSRFRRSAFPVPEFPRNGRPDRRMYMNSLFLIYLTQSRPEFHQSENAAVEKIPKTSTNNRKVILNINIIYFWTWAVLIISQWYPSNQAEPIFNYSSARPYLEIWTEKKKKKTTCKLTCWAKDRRAGESRKLFERAADVRDSANTEYSFLHWNLCAQWNMAVCVWV